MKRALHSIGEVLVFVATVVIIAGGVWYFFGEITITATVEGNPETITEMPKVKIDGVFVGHVPYTVKFLPFTRHRISILAPEPSSNYAQNEYKVSSFMFFFIGQTITTDFTRR